MRKYLLRVIEKTPDFIDLAAKLQSNSLATVYFSKGITTDEAFADFSSYTKYLPTDELFDVVSFCKKLIEHKNNNAKVVVYGDYDADGAVAASVLWRFLSKTLGINATVYIPDRHEEGYGLNKQALLTLAEQGTKLVITVDCGVRDSVLIEEVMRSTVMDIMVTDHHQPGDTFPSCVTVHPLYPNHESKNKFISGGVVVWKIVRYIEDVLKLSHEFSEQVVDIVGVSLVTDMMPLLGENRVILRNAIRKLRSQPSLGLRALMDSSQVKQDEVSTYHIGYILGPRLNASGRIGNQYTSTKLLSTDREDVARKLANEVSEINTKRQEITKEIFIQADKNKVVVGDKVIVTAGEGWEDGIVGLVAGKLMNRYDLPTITVTIDKEKGIAKGSARSFGEMNITGLFEKIAPVFSRYGGHHSAAGFTLATADHKELIENLQKLLDTEYTEFVPIVTKLVDSMVTPNELTDQFFSSLYDLEPFGIENQEPLFAIAGVVAQFAPFGQQGNHLRISLQTENGTVKCMAFDRAELIGQIEQGESLVVIGRPKQDEYLGRKQLSFFVEHIVKGTSLESETK